MLVVTRREQEVIWIEDVKVTITQIRGRTVKVGIEAHKDVKIVRGELKDKEKTTCEPS